MKKYYIPLIFFCIGSILFYIGPTESQKIVPMACYAIAGFISILTYLQGEDK